MKDIQHVVHIGYEKPKEYTADEYAEYMKQRLWDWNRLEGRGTRPIFGRTVVSDGGWALHAGPLYFRYRPYMCPRWIFEITKTR